MQLVNRLKYVTRYNPFKHIITFYTEPFLHKTETQPSTNAIEREKKGIRTFHHKETLRKT
jgi:hypothetical protein